MSGVQTVRWAPWRPVKLIVKATVACAAALGVIYRMYQEPCEP